MDPKELKNVVECLLFVTDKPLSLNTLQALLETEDRRALVSVLDELKADYDMQGRAFQLVEIAEGYQVATRVHYAPWIRKLFKTKSVNKLSRAALETLAIIAYRQPITKAEVEDIRGVSADGVVNALAERKFIRIVGRKEVVGRPILYGTTKEFLHYFGLKDLSDMPTLKDLQEILKEDENGRSWELNEQGELVAKIRVHEDSETPADQDHPSPAPAAAEGDAVDSVTVSDENAAVPAGENLETASAADDATAVQSMEATNTEPVSGGIAEDRPDKDREKEAALAPETADNIAHAESEDSHE